MESDLPQDHTDPLAGLEERLQAHSQAFESLLALTPAREYYGSHFVDGQDPSEQWLKRGKKQTKEAKRAAKKAKLDPANNKSALDVLKEREVEAVARKRKRDGEEVDGDGGGGGEDDGESQAVTKKAKVDEDPDVVEERRREKNRKKKEAKLRKKEKVDRKRAKTEAKKAAKQDQDLLEAQVVKQQRDEAGDEEHLDVEPDAAERDQDMADVDFSGLVGDVDMDDVNGDVELEAQDDAASHPSSAPTTPLNNSPAFDIATDHSRASSSSSIVPPADIEKQHQSKLPQKQPTVETTRTSTTSEPSSKPTELASGASSPKIVMPDIPKEELQERLRIRIEAMRAARKADGPDGKAAKSRQDLLEERRKQAERKKAAKKEQRQKAKEDEQERREAQLRGSGSPLSADIFSPRSPQPRETNYAFSRLAFDDGTSADPSLTQLQDARKKKGPQDPRTALQAAQNKQTRISGYDATKRADIADKDMWLNARKRAHGEHVRDDTSLLKKALKRKEQGKNKSEKEWQEREQAVVKGKEMKQKKREGNLAKRREEKGGGGKGKKKGGGKGGEKKKRRPGFEGRFKA